MTEALVPGERRRTVQLIEQSGIAADGAAWLKEMEAATLAELQIRREATGAELESWLGPMRITPRFPTPLHKALAAGTWT